MKMSEQSLSFDTCPQVVSKIDRPFGSFKLNWLIEGLKDPQNYNSILNIASTELKVGTGQTESILEFALRSHDISDDRYLSLKMTLTGMGPQSCKVFDVEVYEIGTEQKLLNKLNQQVLCKIGQECYPVYKLLRTHIRVSNGYGGQIWEEHKKSPDSIRLGIVVTPVQINSKAKGAMENGNAVNRTGIIDDLKRLYLETPDNFADLTMESKDGIVMNAHMFMLAARSHVLRNFIETAVKQNGFDGTIKLTDVNAKPLMIMLHWMYTGELRQDAGKHIEELVTVAVNYELPELLNLLDGELIKICTTENMLELFQIAKRNNMPETRKKISAFIKENLENDDGFPAK